MGAPLAGGREGCPQQGGHAADGIARLGREQAPLGGLLVFGEDEPFERMPAAVLDECGDPCTRQGEAFQPSVFMAATLSARVQVTFHRPLPERVRDIPPEAVVRGETGDGEYLTDAEVRQTFRTDGGQRVEAGIQHPARAATRREDEILPQRHTHEAGEEPPAVISPLVSLHRVSEDCAVVTSPGTGGS